MKEWFKARNVWGAAITALSDEEAGRLAKAIWGYTMSGEIAEIEGAGKGIYAMILMTLGEDERHENHVSEVRSKATEHRRDRQLMSSGNKWDQLISNDNNCNQLISNDDNKNKNKNKSKNKNKESETETEGFLDAEEAAEISRDHSRVLDAAEDAGFRMSNDVRDSLIALYADHGLQKIQDGLRSCVDHGAPNLAYLKAVLRGEPRKEKPAEKPAGKTVAAQQYTQRDYSEEDADAMRRMLETG